MTTRWLDERSGFLLSTLAALAFAAGCDGKAQADAVAKAASNDIVLNREQLEHMRIETAAVELQNVDDQISATGKVAYDDQKLMHVFSPVAGRVVKVFAALGSHVRKGDALVTLESPDIGLATSDVGKAKAELIAAEHDLMRQRELFATHAASQRDYEVAADNYRKAKAEAERAAQKATLFQKGDATGQSYTIRSDIDGEVFMKAVSPGMELSGQYGGGSPIELLTIGDAARVWVLADIYELDIPRVKLGSKVVVQVVSWPDRSFAGEVDWVSGALDPNTHATRVRCTFENSDRALKPEMFATVAISADAHKAIAIPATSVLRLGDQTVVFIDHGWDAEGRRRFERHPVIVDQAKTRSWLTVEHGLSQGQSIVTSGAILLSGMAP